MIKRSFSLIVLFASLIFNSCNSDDDGYGLGKFIVSLATVNPVDEQTGTYYLTMDDGTTLWPASSEVYYKPKKDQRVMVNFTLLSDSLTGYDHYIKVNDLREILTKKVEDLTVENEDKIGNDPVEILDYWIGDDYLNIHFEYKIGSNNAHTISLVKNTLVDTTSQDGSTILEFRHNKNEDTEKYSVKSYAAFDLKPLQVLEKDSIDFVIKVKDFYDQEKEYKITYHYNRNAARSVSNNKAIISMPDKENLD